MKRERIVVGLSGGVDSSVAALLLQREGRAIAGLYMQNWDDEGIGECHAEDDRRDALGVCARLGIPFHVEAASVPPDASWNADAHPVTPIDTAGIAALAARASRFIVF